ESDGRRRRSLRSLARHHCADALLRLRGVLRLHVAAAEQGRGHSHGFNFRRTLEMGKEANAERSTSNIQLGRCDMTSIFQLNHATLAADPRFAGIARELSA